MRSVQQRVWVEVQSTKEYSYLNENFMIRYLIGLKP